jgi:hypothetical protein
LLRLIWERADLPAAGFIYEEVVCWPRGALDRLLALGLLKPAAHAQAVACDSCGEDHVEEVIFLESPPGSALRAYIPCYESGRVRVPLERLQQWGIDLAGFASAVARAVEASGDVAEVVPDRVWLLGKSSWVGRLHEFFLVWGAGGKDGLDLLHHPRLRAAVAPVVFVPGRLPAALGQRERLPTLLPLSAFLTLGADGLVWDRVALEQVLTPQGSRPAKSPSASFAVPPEARWEDVRLTVRDHELEVEVLGRWRCFTFQEAGFEDRKRRDVPDRLWGFLTLVAQHGGVLPRPKTATERSATNLRKNVSRVSQQLQALLPLDGKPFRGPRQVHGYQARFRIRLADGARFPTPAEGSWERVSLIEVREGVVAVTVGTNDVHAVFDARAEASESPGRWEAVEQPGVVRREYSLADLGLASSDGRRDLAGQALLQVLRAGGRVARTAEDGGMLALNQRLGRFLQLEGPAFRFSNTGPVWIALFEAESRVNDDRL